MSLGRSDASHLENLRAFIEGQNAAAPSYTAISIFSGSGISDFGYRLAGFDFRVQNERDGSRAAIGGPNFPGSQWVVGALPGQRARLVEVARNSLGDRKLDLLSLTPPCQGMSSSNPGRGKRSADGQAAHDARNRLILETIPLADALSPRVIVIENVRQVLTLELELNGVQKTALAHLEDGLGDYTVFHGVINLADHGIPQLRRRAIVVAVSRQEPWLASLVARGRVPWPHPSHAEDARDGRLSWVTVADWFAEMGYPPLDSIDAAHSGSDDPLHSVPYYGEDRYLQISSIPPRTGKSAYENDTCPSCSEQPVPPAVATCPSCDALLRNRPYRLDEDGPRLIRGFHSSYRRMRADRPAPTVTTNSSHVGSDFKVHPWENRVLSALECADLQTIPRTYTWRGALAYRRHYLVRNVIGEGFPTYFTFLHGSLLAQLLSGSSVTKELAAAFAKSGSKGAVRQASVVEPSAPSPVASTSTAA